jgi:hypothetical protein
VELSLMNVLLLSRFDEVAVAGAKFVSGRNPSKGSEFNQIIRWSTEVGQWMRRNDS